MNDDEFFDLCMINRKLRIERNSHGVITVAEPAGAETSYRNCDLSRQLANCSQEDGRGRAFASNTGFILPDSATLAPDAAWVLKSRLDLLTKEQKRRFLPLCPDFVVELVSPSDRLKTVKDKMPEWMDNGAQLGWLIDPDRRAIYIYRPKQEPEHLTDIEHLQGELPVDGFDLDLTDIWAEL